MFTYKWVKLNQMLKRIEDNAYIPADPGNRDYKEFLDSGAVALGEDLPPTQDQNAQGAADGVDRLLFDVLFNHENRIRVLEAKPAITRAVYRQALVDRWKVLNP